MKNLNSYHKQNIFYVFLYKRCTMTRPLPPSPIQLWKIQTIWHVTSFVKADKEINFLLSGFVWLSIQHQTCCDDHYQKPTHIASSASEIATQCQTLFTSAGVLVLSPLFFLPLQKKIWAAAGKNVKDYYRALIKTPQAASPPNLESVAATALYLRRCRGPAAAEKCEGLVERSAAPFVSLARHQMWVSYFPPRYSRSIGVVQWAV